MSKDRPTAKTLDEIISEVEDIHPYKEAGNADSYSQYNEGWSDACDVLGERIKAAIQQESVGSSQSVTNCNQLKLLESIAIWLTSCVNDHYESGAQSDLDAVELWITQLASGQQESLKDTLIGFWEWMDDIDLKDKKNHSLEDFVDSFIKAHHLSGLPPKPTEI